MAIDRDAMITSMFFGYGEKNWSLSVSGNKDWYSPDLIQLRLQPGRSQEAACRPRVRRTRNGDGVIEDTRGNPVSFMLKTNCSNALRVGMMNFIATTSPRSASG